MILWPCLSAHAQLINVDLFLFKRNDRSSVARNLKTYVVKSSLDRFSYVVYILYVRYQKYNSYQFINGISDLFNFFCKIQRDEIKTVRRLNSNLFLNFLTIA
jgi:hypothetical protein